MQFAAGLFACELPVDDGVVTVDAASPSINVAAKCRQVSDSAFSKTLAAEQAHFDLSLVEPTSVFGCLVNGKAIPKAASNLVSKLVYHRLTRM